MTPSHDDTGAVGDARQHTVAESVTVRGVGLFTANEVTATIRPAEADTGVVFRRVDLPGKPVAPACVHHVEPAMRRTVLAQGEARVETVEHCLGALAGLGVDNAIVELDAPELPIGDGSASLFTEAIARVGTRAQDAQRNPIVITEPITVSEGDATLTAMPAISATTELEYLLDYGASSPIERQTHAFTLSDGTFVGEVAPARTYSTEDEARAARAMGLFGHFEPKDMLVIGRSGPIDNAYRFENEPVRHKLLDLLGDISLVGRPIHGRLVAHRSGHALNHQLGRAILDAHAPC